MKKHTKKSFSDVLIIQKFCKEQSLEEWQRLSPIAKEILLKVASFCAQNHKGDQRLAKIILTLSKDADDSTKLDYCYSEIQKLKIGNHQFLNFTSEFGKDGLNFTWKWYPPHPFEGYKCKKREGGCPTWEKILCEEQKVGKFTVKTECLNPRKKPPQAYPAGNTSTYKVFVKGYENFLDYVKDIQKGEVTKEEHIQLFQFLYKTVLPDAELGVEHKLRLINHNLDVNTLHFKFETVRSDGDEIAKDVIH